MNVNISVEFIFSEVHRNMDRSGSLAKFKMRSSFTLHAIHCGT